MAGNVEGNEVREVIMRRVPQGFGGDYKDFDFCSEVMCPCTVLDREVTSVLTYVLKGIPLAVVLRTHPEVGAKWKPGEQGGGCLRNPGGVTLAFVGFGNGRRGSVLKMEPGVPGWLSR